MKQLNAKLSVAAVIILVFLGVEFTNGIKLDKASVIDFPTFNTDVKKAKDQPLRSLKDLNDAIVNVAKKTNPTVVTIFTTQTIKVRQQNPFSQFFGGQPDQERQYQRRGLGSGVIVSDDGYILTNNHVIADADTIKVRLYNDEEVPAKVIGTDKQTDIGVIKIDADNLPVAQLGDSDSLRVGEMVLAIGSPLSPNLAHTVTMGIVSARGRTVRGLARYQDYIQTDAAINPGNSGGALINLDGKVVGINSAIASESGGYQGIGFAIPINMAQNVMNSIIEHGRVIRAYLGIRMGPVDETMAKALNLDQAQGVLVNSVEDGTPAAKAGLKEGDVIVKLNGDKVANMTRFASRIASNSPGTKVNLEVIRDGKRKDLTVTLTERPENLTENGGSGATGSLEQKLGFAVNTMDSDLAQKYDIDTRAKGVVVTGIGRRSEAYQRGLREGDLIISVGNRRVTNKKEFDDLMNQLIKNGSDVALLRVMRNGQGLFVSFKLK